MCQGKRRLAVRTMKAGSQRMLLAPKFWAGHKPASPNMVGWPGKDASLEPVRTWPYKAAEADSKADSLPAVAISICWGSCKHPCCVWLAENVCSDFVELDSCARGLTTNIDHVAATLAQYVLTTEQAGGTLAVCFRLKAVPSSKVNLSRNATYPCNVASLG